LADLDDLYAVFPRLQSADHLVTSGDSDTYNCVAWVQRDTRRQWDPDFYWPPGVPKPALGDSENDLPNYIALFESVGFELCDGSDLEPGYLKIAIYATGNEFHHVAKQLPSGGWSSKGSMDLHDFRHEQLEPLNGTGVWKGACARVFMRRPYDGVDPFTLEETGIILVGGVDVSRASGEGGAATSG
jgi:hypothetical protein